MSIPTSRTSGGLVRVRVYLTPAEYEALRQRTGQGRSGGGGMSRLLGDLLRAYLAEVPTSHWGAR